MQPVEHPAAMAGADIGVAEPTNKAQAIQSFITTVPVCRNLMTFPEFDCFAAKPNPEIPRSMYRNDIPNGSRTAKTGRARNDDLIRKNSVL